MPNNLVNNVRLRGILGVGWMSNILGGTEYSMGEAVQEFSLTQNAYGWPDSKISLGLQECIEISYLGQFLRKLEFSVEGL